MANYLIPSTLSAYLTSWNCIRAYYTIYHLPIPSLDIMSICTLHHPCCSHHYPDVPGKKQLFHRTSHSHVPLLIKGLCKQELSLPANRLLLIAVIPCFCIHSLRSGCVFPTMYLGLKSIFALASFRFLGCSEFTLTEKNDMPLLNSNLFTFNLFMNNRFYMAHYRDTYIIYIYIYILLIVRKLENKDAVFNQCYLLNLLN